MDASLGGAPRVDTPAPVDKDPFMIKNEEQARPDDGRIDVVPVRALTASAASLAMSTPSTLPPTVLMSACFPT